ncbi:type 1 glutamine amidotransferase [Nocardioidaceae bacterium]|nr:type 1 glutamine amidotransferase [Nocardioidaceae bacterium]
MEGIERVELEQPWEAVTDGGHEAVLISTDTGEVQTFDHLTEASTQKVDQVVGSVSVDDFDALVLPGGVANPDALRMNSDAVSFVGEFVRSGKPVAAICHAPWTLVEADVLKDRTLTSWPSLQTDIRNAGATWVDERVNVDGNLISSRNPDDIPAFISALMSSLDHGVDTARNADTDSDMPA